MPLTPTTRLGSYEIIAPLGAGGMGEVVASSPELLARLEHEATTVAGLNHPNIVVLHCAGLRARQARNAGLEYGPHEGRDHDDASVGRGHVAGTVPCMAPEQVRGESVDARTDLFALGLVLYELAVGKRPFAGATNADISSAILRDAPKPLASMRRDLPPDREEPARTHPVGPGREQRAGPAAQGTGAERVRRGGQVGTREGGLDRGAAVREPERERRRRVLL